MLSKLISYWQFGSTYFSVEVTNSGKNEMVFIARAKKRNQEFTGFEYVEKSSLKEISNELGKNQHIFLTINTDKVLIKQIQDRGNVNSILSKAFPGLNYSEFYYNILTTDKNSFVSVCRKDYIHDLIDTLKKEKIDVIGFELGFVTLSNLITSIDENSIETEKFQFTIENEQISKFEQKTKDSSTLYSIDKVEVPSKFIIALSGLINYVSQTNHLVSNYNETNNLLKQDHSQKNFFRKGTVIILGVLLVSLLINAIVFSSNFKKQQTLNEEFQLINNQQELFLLRKNELESKERLVDNILNKENSKSSFYINRIISVKPNTIIFNLIEYQPLEKAIHPDRIIEYNTNQIIIRGVSTSKVDFTAWIESLESEKWIGSALVNNYAQSSQNFSTFQLRLILDQNGSKK